MSAITNVRGSPANGEQRVTLLLGIKFYVWLDGFTATTTKAQSLHSKPVVGKYDSFLAIRTWESRMFENGVYLDIITAELLELASTRVIDRHRIDPIPTLNSHSFGDMAFFFRTKKQDVVKPTKELLTRLWQPPKSQKAEEELSRCLSQIRVTLTGTQELDSDPVAVADLLEYMKTNDFLFTLARSIHLLPFEARKDSQAIFSYALRFRPPGSTDEDAPGLSYVINERPEVLVELCRGYGHRDSALPCGMVLREIIKQHEAVAAIILYDNSQGDGPASTFRDIDTQMIQTGDGVFWEFFKYIDQGAFEVSADAFTTFRELLTKHKPLVAQYLNDNFELFFKRYNSILIGSKSYVTKRQSIKLLGEILLDRNNFNVMTEYVSRGDHLKLMMNLLRDDRKMVQYEGFHVFKVFAANPNKSDSVKKILNQNRERLLRFLPSFLADRTDDDQFTDEKAYLISSIEKLPGYP